MSELSSEVELETKTSLWNVFLWSLYDLANTVYSMVIVSLIINQYIIIIGQRENFLTYARTEIIYGTVVMVMQLIIAIGMPIAGALSDYAGKRKPFVLILTGIILIFASLLGIFQSLWMVLLFYVIANMAYQWSLAFYDSMLPFIAAPRHAGKVGGFGVAFGYLGTIIGIAAMLVLSSIWGSPHSDPKTGFVKYGYLENWWTYVIAMGIFALFAIPFFFVKERTKKGKAPPMRQIVKGSFKQLGSTFRDIRQHREMFKFIIGYFLIVEVANVVIIKMILIVTDGMGMDYAFGNYFIIIATISAVLFTYPVGIFADRQGAKKTFIMICSFWVIALIIAIVASLVWSPIAVPELLGGATGNGWSFAFIMVLIMGIIAGPALGGTWVAQRYMIIELAPKEKFGEYMGFSKLSGKVSASLGPLIWAAIIGLSEVTGANWATSSAISLAVAVMGIIMIAGLVIILFVKPSKSILKEDGIIATK